MLCKSDETIPSAVCEDNGSCMERLYDRYTNTDDAGVRTIGHVWRDSTTGMNTDDEE